MAEHSVADRLGVGSPLIVSTVDGAASRTVTVGAFLRCGGRLYFTTFNTGYTEVRVAVQDHRFKLKPRDPPIGRTCYVDEKCRICLVEVTAEIARHLSQEQKCVSGLYGEMCHVDVYNGDFESLVGREVQTIQKSGFRYGHIIGFDRGSQELLVRNVYPGMEFSGDGDQGALVTSLPMKEAVEAYGVIAGCDAAGVSRVHPFGADLEYIERRYLGGERIQVYQPVKRPLSSKGKKLFEEREEACYSVVPC